MATSHRATIVIDLGYGDAGKGSVVDYLARTQAATVAVRFNGGAQAAHNVVTPDGRHHTFHQFGSASLVPGCRTHLSRFMLLDPLGLAREAAELRAAGVSDPQSRLTIDEAALVVTPYHQATNRLREIARGQGRHGSCGEGIGETMADFVAVPDDALRTADLTRPSVARRKLEAARERKLDQLAGLLPELAANPQAARDLETLHDAQLSAEVVEFYATFVAQIAIVDGDYLGQLLRATPHVVFEGAQGVLLDEWRGFHPYTTWSTTTFANADQLLAEQGYDGQVTHLGLLRAYAARHGAGPFVTEDPVLTVDLPELHNLTNPWQREFRLGRFDLVAARYALEVAGTTDALAVTCLDRLPATATQPVCQAYDTPTGRLERLEPGPFTDLTYQQQLTQLLLKATPLYEAVPSDDYLEVLEQKLQIPIVLTSHGPAAGHKRQRCTV